MNMQGRLKRLEDKCQELQGRTESPEIRWELEQMKQELARIAGALKAPTKEGQ